MVQLFRSTVFQGTRHTLFHVSAFTKAGVGERFRTAERFQPGIILRTGPPYNIECSLHANLLQLISHHGTDSVRDLGLFHRKKIPRPVGIAVVNAIRVLFLMAVVPGTFGPIWPWFHTARQQPIPLRSEMHR